MWLLKRDVLQAMRAARSSGYEPTLEERASFARAMREAYASGEDSRPHCMTIAGNTAQIVVEGVLTEKPDCWALMFGGGNTTYESIRKSLALAEADPAVKNIVLLVSSPGGHVNGLFETFAALDAVTKPISVRSNYAASAAYGLAAVAGPIEATSPAAEFGSVGVVAGFYLDDEIVEITSTEAPKKRPDVTTEEGVAMVREELDALHELFVDRIAKGRSFTIGETVTLGTVNAEFGRGGSFVAAAAKKRGMIDKIAAQPKRTRTGRGYSASDSVDVASQLESALLVAAPELPAARIGEVVQTVLGMPAESTGTRIGDTKESIAEPEASAPVPTQNKNASAAAGGAQPSRKNMTEAELRAQHPELFAALDKKHETAVATAKADGIKEGTETERKRVLGHIKLGDAAGDLKIAHDAIASGASTADVHDDYLAARMRRGAVENRQTETDAANAAADGAKAAEVKGARELVADEFERLMGGEVLG